MLVDCMLFQPYRSLTESQNGCLDHSNPNSVIGSTINQFETPVRVDISMGRFPLSFISSVNLSIIFLYFTSIDFFHLIFEFLQIIFDYIVCCKF